MDTPLMHDYDRLVLLPLLYELREFHSKFMCGLHFAAERGACLVGVSAAINDVVRFGMAKGGVYVGYNTFQHYVEGRTKRYDLFKKAGVDILRLDEEGAVYPGGEEDWARVLRARFDIKHMQAPDRECSWGQWQADLYRNELGGRDDIEVTAVGNPRFDLCRAPWSGIYDERVAELRRTYGDFILVNSNTALANLSNRDMLFSPASGYRSVDGDYSDMEYYLANWRNASEGLGRFIDLVMRMARHFGDDRTIVLRPHPAEDLDTYEKALPFPNVHVVREGNVAPWVLACDVMIHDGCTTALEAHMAQKPSIYMHSARDADRLSYLPAQVSHCVTSVEEVIDLLESGCGTVEVSDLARALLFNFNEGVDSFSALQACMDELPASSPRGSLASLTALQAFERSLSTARAVKASGRRRRLVRRRDLRDARVSDFRTLSHEVAPMLSWAKAHLGKDIQCDVVSDRLMLLRVR